jgi:long-subunit acyl-CoA synthetase (AMP-forming)
VFGPIKAILGGRMRLVLSGGAPLSPETHEQMNACLCATIIQGYGLTESTSCATVQDCKSSFTLNLKRNVRKSDGSRKNGNITLLF